ncbi:hypothetical protein [Gemmatimonas sp.]|jgi:hypothetical protein|uniref:hypothetical protein n=1 Tax=Gemmatimonas sp. TaxID=1962908 RepID=UPI0037BF82E4
MFHTFRQRERSALAPLLGLARGMSDTDRAEWLADLRRDAPLVMTLVERMLAEERPRQPLPARSES